ncbi:hypothetical protein [Lysobacter gummosus]|uniref:hypothetical protein n=1 Tax=Lysobacter gummosus TaxID=262324 RepID=UPI003640324C
MSSARAATACATAADPDPKAGIASGFMRRCAITQASLSRNFSASSAAMQPKPAEVMAWR